MKVLTKFYTGEDATAENFNLCLIDADDNFDETDERLGVLGDEIDALEAAQHDEASVYGWPLTITGQQLRFLYDTDDFQVNGESGNLELKGEGGGGGLPPGFDNIIYTWKDNSTVTVLPGECLSADETTVFTITSNTDVGFVANLAYGESESANSKWRLWIGKNSSEADEIVLSQSESATPNQHASASPLTHPHLLRGCLYNNAISNLIRFMMDQKNLYYDVATYDATEPTIFLSATVGAWQDADPSPFIPKGRRRIFVVFNAPSVVYHLSREKGGAEHAGIVSSRTDSTYHNMSNYSTPVDENGKYQISSYTSGAVTLWITGFEL